MDNFVEEQTMDFEETLTLLTHQNNSVQKGIAEAREALTSSGKIEKLQAIEKRIMRMLQLIKAEEHRVSVGNRFSEP